MRTTSVRNNRGNVLLQVLAATAAMSISFYFLTNYVIGQKKQISKTVNAVNLRFALNSTMDYVIFGVRQKYCFTDDGLLMDDKSKCDLTNTGSVERLIMSPSQANFIRMMKSQNNIDFGVGVDYNNLPLNVITRKLEVNKLSAAHPLIGVMQKLASVKDEITGEVIPVGGVKVVLTRDNSPYLPVAGREVYIKISLALLDKSDRVIKLAEKPLVLNSSLSIYPREVGSFALLIPNDLHLDLPGDSAPTLAGDVNLHQFANRKDVQGPGLVFLSPVFVNRDIYLPEVTEDKTATADTSKYAAVTFADRVVMGNGWLRTAGNKMYAPRTSGNLQDRYWADSTSFGGFLKGIENDGGLDKGLLVFGHVAGASGLSPADTAKAKECQKMAVLDSDITQTLETQLGASLRNYDPNQPNEIPYKLYFSSWNTFNAQNIDQGPSDTSKWDNGYINYSGSNSGPVMKVSFTLGNRSIELEMPFGSEVTLRPKIGSATTENSLLAAKKSAATTLSAAQTAYDDATAQEASLKKKLADKQQALADEMAKPLEPAPAPSPSPSPSPEPSPSPSPSPSPEPSPSPSPEPSPSPSPSPVDYRDEALVTQLQKDISNLNAQLTALGVIAKKTALDSAQAAYDVANGKYTDYMNAVSIRPEVTIAVDSSRRNKAQINFSVKNADHFINELGKPSAPVVGVLAYDYSYYKGQPIYPTPNANLQGYLNFTMSADNKSLVPPTNMSATAANTSTTSLAEDDPNGAADTLLDDCEKYRSAATSQSFGGASWNVDYSATTRYSWNFAADGGTIGQDPAINSTIVLDGTNSPAPYAAPNWPKFNVYSIAKACQITATAKIVTGFFACDTLTIDARSTPLRIIGTFIVGKLFIAKEAYKAGITWSTIYYPQATNELRDIGILHPYPGSSCDIKSTTSPVWHPIPSVQELSNRMTCNAISLRSKADPFQWTSVDPDCGLPAVSGTTPQTNTTCKRRLVRFYVVEQGREGGL